MGISFFFRFDSGFDIDMCFYDLPIHFSTSNEQSLMRLSNNLLNATVNFILLILSHVGTVAHETYMILTEALYDCSLLMGLSCQVLMILTIVVVCLLLSQ